MVFGHLPQYRILSVSEPIGTPDYKLGVPRLGAILKADDEYMVADR